MDTQLKFTLHVEEGRVDVVTIQLVKINKRKGVASCYMTILLLRHSTDFVRIEPEIPRRVTLTFFIYELY